MGALSAPPEAGDAPYPCNMRRGKKCVRTEREYRKSSAYPPANGDSNDRNPSLSVCDMASNSVVREAPYDHVALIESEVLREADIPAQLRVDNCGFPYYRSNRGSGRSQDAVLVKDAAVSCTLLNDKMCGKSYERTAGNINEPQDTPKSSTIESYLVKQLKIEYNDLSNITRKISAYTKDILSSLVSRERKKSRISEKSMHRHAVASHHVDEMGNPYLRLRLQDDAETQYYSPQENISTAVNRPDSASFQRRNTADVIRDEDQRTRRSDKRSKNGGTKLHAEYQLQKLFPVDSTKARIDSSTCSGSSIHNFLLAGKRQSSKEVPRIAFQNLYKTKSRRGIRKRSYASEQREMHSKPQDSVPVTNWKEITKAVAPNSGRLSSEVSTQDSKHEAVRDRDMYSSILNGKHNGRHAVPATDDFLRDTNFHTVNIRIVTKGSGH